MRDFAERLIAYETKENLSSGTPPAAFLVYEKLGPYLTTLMGTAGVRALLSRALALANDEVAWLRARHVNADGSVEGLEELHAQLDPEEFIEGRRVLVAQLLGWLVAFIGQNLTLRLVGEVWPKVPVHDLNVDTGDRNEKTTAKEITAVSTNHGMTWSAPLLKLDLADVAFETHKTAQPGTTNRGSRSHGQNTCNHISMSVGNLSRFEN